MLGRCLGPAKNEENKMTQWIWKQNEKVALWQTVQKLTNHHLSISNELEVYKRKKFHADIRRTLGNSFTLPTANVGLKGATSETDDKDNVMYNNFYRLTPYDGNKEHTMPMSEANCTDANDLPSVNDLFTDTLVQAKVILPKGRIWQRQKW